jgi:hypothetical protein
VSSSLAHLAPIMSLASSRCELARLVLGHTAQRIYLTQEVATKAHLVVTVVEAEAVAAAEVVRIRAPSLEV